MTTNPACKRAIELAASEIASVFCDACGQMHEPAEADRPVERQPTPQYDVNLGLPPERIVELDKIRALEWR